MTLNIDPISFSLTNSFPRSYSSAFQEGGAPQVWQGFSDWILEKYPGNLMHLSSLYKVFNFILFGLLETAICSLSFKRF